MVITPQEHEKNGRFKSVDYTGMRFGRLVVLGVSDNVYVDKKGRKYKLWDCQCDCGNIISVRSCQLIAKSKSPTRSCGCLRVDVCRETHTKHGGKCTRLYQLWKNIRRRCYNKNSTEYQYYGGRGITMCDEWYNDFLSFKNWAIESGYDETAKFGECTIDRIDVNGDYSPENCRWLTIQEQAKNRRSNTVLEFNGEKKILKDWAEEIGMKVSTLSGRINVQGLSVEEALTRPLMRQKSRKENSYGAST